MSTCVYISISNKICVVVINHDEQEDILYNINHITELHIMYFRYRITIRIILCSTLDKTTGEYTDIIISSYRENVTYNFFAGGKQPHS